MEKKKNIAVIFGGKSAEHDVSIITAHIPIITALETVGTYDVWPIYISKEGCWYSAKAMNQLGYFKDPNFASNLAKEKKIELSLNGEFKIIWPGLLKKEVSIDIVFPAMHGTYGEDGSLMGVLRMADVPFVGCDIFASAVAMDKVLSKQVATASAIPVVPYEWFTRHDWQENKQDILNKISKLKFPLFVKPVHLGSSIGISKVKNNSELVNAIEVALHYDEKVLVEEGVENLIEVTLPITGNEAPSPSAVERPLNKTEFFDFNDKYLSGGKGSGVNSQYSEIPANIDQNLYKEVEELGKKTYKVLGCTGIARVDFLIDSATNKVYMNEINTLPGSLYDHNFRKTGVSSVELVTRLVGLALERYEKEHQTSYAFNSKILQAVSGPKVQPHE